MPKLEEMAQLSRPFQIGLVAVCLVAAVWLFALQGHSASTSATSSSPTVSASAPSTSAPASPATGQKASSSTAAAEAKSAGTPTPIYHGSAPGVEGLTRAISKAHEAVAISQNNANQLEDKSARASNEAPAAQTSPATTPTPGASAKASVPAAKAPSRTSTSPSASTVHSGSSAPGSTSAAATPAGQRTVEAELAKGNVVVLLFWDPTGSDDIAVHRDVQQLGAHAHKVAVHEALPGAVASFGSVTRDVQVYTTPTILIVNKSGQTTTLTGLQDAFSIEQAIAEARQS